MKLIKQPSKTTGCGPAVYGMIVGLSSFANAKRLMRKGKWMLTTGNVRIEQMQEALRQTLGCKIRRLKREPKSARTYALYCRFGRYRHWVAVHDGKYFDPLCTSSRQAIDYEVLAALVPIIQ